MEAKHLFFMLLIFCLFPFFSMAETVNPCRKSTEGTDFWFGFMESRNYNPNHYVEVTLTSPYTCKYEIRIGKSNNVFISGTLLPNIPQRIPLPWLEVEATGSETVQDKAIHLTSDQPMNVYALNYDVNSSDVALIFPTSALGKEYFAICYEPHISESNQGAYGNGRNSEFLIVATEDRTTVTIVPTKVTDQLKPANVPFQIKLNKGEVYQVQSMNRNNTPGQGDLSGSNIVSDKPVAFFSGSLATTVPATNNVSAWDHLYEQVPPVQAWGNLFMAVPLKSRQRDTYRIFAAYDNTSVKVGNDTYVLDKKGDKVEFMLEYTDPRLVESTKPILLVQYSNSQSVDASFTGGNGDPFMIIVSPLNQTKQNVTFVAYHSTKITNRYFVNVITKDISTASISLDKAPIQFTSLPNTGYSYAQIAIQQGNHQLQTSSEDKGFIAYVYGFGGVESYGYGVGFNLDIQLELGGNLNNDTLVICKGTEVKLEAGAYFDNYEWSTGDTIPFITVSEERMYSVKASTIGGCIKSDSVYLMVSDPKINLGRDTTSCGPGKIILDAGSGFKTYRWQDGSTNQTFTVLTSGDYAVTGINEFGCKASDTVQVEVFQVPQVKILGEALHCGVFTADLKVEVTQADENLWNYPGAAQWTSIPADGMQFNDIQPAGVTLVATKPGLYTIHYTLTTLNGCTDSDTFQIGFYETPESSFDVISPASTDKCSTYERIVNYTGKNGSGAKFNWDFGGLMVLDTIGPNNFKISIGANKPNRTISLVVEEHGCTSELRSKSIGVTPTFSFGADKVHGCDAMCVQFNSKVTIEDAVTYLWTFGDGAVSDLQNPLHCYTDTGKYDVSLVVTNVIDGCRNGSVEPEMIKIYKTPVARLSVDPEFCYGDTVSFEYLNKKEVSNCSWFAKGNELISNENTSATYWLKNEISEVGFIVEENGCSCDTFKVEVKRKPNFDFEAMEPELCLLETSKLRAIAQDPNLQYSWSVDSLSEVKGDSLVHLFSRPGFYPVTLRAFSELTGCSDEITKPDYLSIYPLPEPAFSQNYRVATIEHADIQFSNQTQGAESYFWTFGDGHTSTEKEPLHQYTKIGDYQVLLLATTGFGCVDTIGSKVKIIPFSFYAPNAFRPDSEISENRTFLPIPKGIDAQNYHFQVFSRLGSTIFETRNPELGWDGNSSNGSASGPGIFVWVVKFKDVQGYQHEQKGTVMLVR